jgi:hypothetical protein
MRNQAIKRASLPAVAGITLSAAAAGGVIDGAVIFPSQLVPPMTVYVSDLDTQRVRLAQLQRGQVNFSVEVPAGRYWVFLAPNEPGAPNVYGAYTQYSLCAHDNSQSCADHSLVALTVSAKTPHAAVTIDDWYLTDEVAGQIDRIRNAADGGAARSDSEPLGAPRFSEYPSAPFDPAAAPKIDGGGDLSEEDRAGLQRALDGGPNFAGYMTAALGHCGAACSRLLLMDWRTGQRQEPPLPGDIQGELPCRAEEALVFRRDSRLLSVTRMRGALVVTQYYVWNQRTTALVLNGEYLRTVQAFCAVAAR